MSEIDGFLAGGTAATEMARAIAATRKRLADVDVPPRHPPASSLLVPPRSSGRTRTATTTGGDAGTAPATRTPTPPVALRNEPQANTRGSIPASQSGGSHDR